MSLRSMLFLVCTGYSLNALAADQNAYDEICTIYTEAINSTMSVNTASEYILNNIEHRISSSEAIQAHQVMLEAMGDTRYTLFKSFAEHELKTSWDCESMKQMLDKHLE